MTVTALKSDERFSRTSSMSFVGILASVKRKSAFRSMRGSSR